MHRKKPYQLIITQMDEMGVTPGSLSVSKLLVYLLCFLKVASAFALYLHLVPPGSIQYSACAYMQTCTLKLSSHVAHTVAM